ncbi:MAG: hypothetical protein HQL05_05675 [Nitrospirae bacterium]|uniref:hypothetical protein n=1 Tax=Candidatus Magnetobacterium casense TaxID=1455061 RepID=UPI00058CD9EB|nr:hypothetical protein [Candidatus Magnetobacterium casensis]MBF0337303.1 hypothetical protein [Nitrospirota bacterium]
MYGFVNEFSFAGQAKNLNQCTELIGELIKTIDVLRPVLTGNQVHVSRNLWQYEISSGYAVKRFIYDNSIDQAIRSRFLRYVTKGPYFETLIEYTVHQCTITSNNQDATGSSIAAAAQLSGILTSLKNAPPFGLDHIEVLYCDETGKEQPLKIDNIFDHSIAKCFCNNAIKTDITSWDDFWNQRKLLFPELIFCEAVKVQLRDGNFKVLSHLIFRHLKYMNDYISNVRTGKVQAPDFQNMGIKATPEIDITLKHYGRQRTFECPDGVERTFSWHSKLYGQNIRIHFHPPDADTNDFIIGYIGEHLPV